MTSYQARRTPRDQTHIIRGLRHHLTCWGPQSDSPWVLLHGWADAGATFQFVVDCFSKEHSCVALDWRGFGRSEWDPVGYWFPDYIADLDAFLDLVSPGRPVKLIGHSMGGNIAGLYAGIRPERVASFVNLEGFGMSRTLPAHAPHRYREWLGQLRSAPEFSSYASFAEFASVLMRRNPRLLRDRAELIARSWGREDDNGPIRLRSDPRHKLVNPVLYRRDEAEACWHRVSAPVLFLLGEHTELRAALGADGSDAALQAMFPHARLATIAGAGHMLHHEQPEAVARAIEEFLQGF
jgi:pimeloyl-ACP methyl ester carboxylesterase